MKPLFYLMIISVLISCSDETREKAQDLYRQSLRLYIQKDLAGAEATLIRALNYDSTLKEGYLLLAKVYFFRGEDEDFVETIEEYLDITEKNPEGLLLYARWHMKKQQYDKAGSILEKVIRTNGNHPLALYLMGSLHLRKGENDKAIIIMNRAMNNYYYLSKIHAALSSTYEELGLEKRSNEHQHMSHLIEQFMEGEK
ncbi:MAG: tetratricopeptide repeat protein [Spirochaetota bacterium]